MASMRRTTGNHEYHAIRSQSISLYNSCETPDVSIQTFRRKVCNRKPYGYLNYGVIPPSLDLEYHQLCCCAGCLVVVVVGALDAWAQCTGNPNLLVATGTLVTSPQKQCRLIWLLSTSRPCSKGTLSTMEVSQFTPADSFSCSRCIVCPSIS